MRTPDFVARCALAFVTALAVALAPPPAVAAEQGFVLYSLPAYNAWAQAGGKSQNRTACSRQLTIGFHSS